jgi:hypothetical protein
MPDGHLLAAAHGAGYILDINPRMLIEKLGDHVMDVLRYDSGTHLIVNHDDQLLERFGASAGYGRRRQIGDSNTRRVDNRYNFVNIRSWKRE